MLLNYLLQGYSLDTILVILIVTLPTILISLTFHEVAHGFVSYKQGDPTAYNLGRLTLDPIKHLDPVGSICMLLFGIGWAKPVPVNARYYKNPKWGMALTALAGPCANLLLSFIGTFILVILERTGLFYSISVGSWNKSFSYMLLVVLYLFLSNFITLNVYLAVFNCIPIPPFDGSRIVFALLPSKWYFAIMKYERIIMVIMLLALYAGLLSGPLNSMTNFLVNGMYDIVYTVCDWVQRLWNLVF